MGQLPVKHWHFICTCVFSWIFTARIRRMTGSCVFTGVCLFTFRQGVPPSSWWGSTPILPDGGRVTHHSCHGVPPSQVWVGVPLSPCLNGGNPIQSWWWVGFTILLDGGYPMDGGTPCHEDWMGVPPSRPGKEVLTIQTWEGDTSPPPSRPGKGYPPSRSSPKTVGYPQLEHDSVYLLCSGQYASYVHAWGLSCSVTFYLWYK